MLRLVHAQAGAKVRPPRPGDEMEAEPGGERLRVRVNDELVLDAGTCEDVAGPSGSERLIRPPAITLFHQVLAYLQAKPDPPARPSGSAAGREGVAAAAVGLRWGLLPRRAA